jgi:hypothetical protein
MKLRRREFLASLAASPLLGVAWPAPALAQSQSPLALAADEFIIAGRRRFLVGGSIDYFRCPSQLWRDRLLKAKRAGLNAVATYVAWNFHEREEGIFDFSGDCDLPRFLDLCHELGLFAFVRPGPFICDEWDAGGYPAWLAAKSDVQLRTNHAPTMALIRRWFEQLIPKVADRQVTRGGPVILVQQENEYLFPGRPGAREYQDFLIRTMRELGIEVPITDCNGFNAGIRRPDSMQTVNNWSTSTAQNLRKRQAGKPVVVSEFYTHSSECWGADEVLKPGAALLREQTFECLATGAMPFYFMFHGGTNFGFWASRTDRLDYNFILPHYYSRGPIAEGGALNDTYFAVKAGALAAESLEQALAGSRSVNLPVKLQGPIRGLARAGEQGTILFLFQDTGKDTSVAGQAAITLPSERRLELAAQLPAIVPLGLELGAGRKVDFTNAALIAASPAVVVISGDADRKGVISINGKVMEFRFTTEPQVLSVGTAVVLAVPTESSDRTWLADGRIIVGPAGVGERRGDKHECWCDAETKTVRLLARDGVLTGTPVPEPRSGPTEFALTDWQGAALPEPEGAGAWRELNHPQPMEELKAYWSYGWYRAKYHSDQARSTALFFTNASDRVHVFRNGKRAGIFGRGHGASRDPLPLELAAGDNHFVFLCDNMGRLSEGNRTDPKGITGPVFLDARELKVNWTAQPSPAAPPSSSWRFLIYKSRTKPENWFRASGEITVATGQMLVLSLRSLPQFAWLKVNGQLVGEHSGDQSLVDGVSYSTYVIQQVDAGTLSVELVACGEALQDLTEHVRIIACPRDRALSGWSFRAWAEPAGRQATEPGMPATWQTRFPRPQIPGPLFFEARGLSKGQAFLNGRAAGRYWHIGPQKALYLPEPWFEDQNLLMVFDEEGRQPSGARLVRDPRWPAQMVLV